MALIKNITSGSINGIVVTGSLNVSSGITGSLFGTASWAENAQTASYVQLAQTASYYDETDPIFTAKSGSFATTGSNVFIGNQTITGSLTITSNLNVLGSASIVYISESTLNIGTNLITVNTFNPSVRFGGLAVIDSGSSPQHSGSILFDSQKDQFIFTHQSAPLTSSVFLLGPETYNDLGNEIYLTQNRIPKGTGIEHLNDSNISDNGSVVSINSNAEITGSLTVSQAVSASSFSGSGANLFGIPASGIVGLNLSQISSGSVSASISPNGGLQVNTNVTATSFTGSLFGTASWANNATTASFVQNAQSASYILNAVSSSFASTASYVLDAISSSFASTASYVLNAVSASFAPNLYNTDGTLTSTRTIDIGSNSLQISSGGNNYVTVNNQGRVDFRTGSFFYSGMFYVTPITSYVAGNPTAHGLTFRYDQTPGNNFGLVASYDWSTGTYQPLFLDASPIRLNAALTAPVSVGVPVATSPTAKLQVRGTGATSITTAFLVENVSAQSSLVILDDRTVGIRKTPTTTLDVNGSTFITGSLSITSGSSLINSSNLPPTPTQFIPFTDDYNRATLSPGGTPSLTYTNTNTGTGNATIVTNYLNIVNGGTAGQSYTTVPLSGFATPFNPTLASNNPTSSLEWSFNLRTNRGSIFSGFAAGQYGGAVVLAGSSGTLQNTGTGYALVYGGTGTRNWRLVRFLNGLQGTLTDIISGGIFASNTSYVSVRITYAPATNTWTYFFRDDGLAAWGDPTTTNTLIGTAVDSTYTSTLMSVFGIYYNYSTAANQNLQFDNLRVQQTATPPLIPIDIFTIKNYLGTSTFNVKDDGTTSITSSLTVTSGITGSLFGTSSWANNAVTASYVLNAVSSSFATTSSFATSASFAPNIYNTNGTLTAARTVTLSGNPLSILGSTTTRFFSNGRVGIATATDGGFQLDVNGTTRLQGALTISTGGATVTGALNASNITGSLFGTSSWAVSASWAPMIPAGSNTQIQFNSGSVFSGSVAFTFNYTSQSLQQGKDVIVSGVFSHAQGSDSQAIGGFSHAEGVTTQAIGEGSHAEGNQTVASGSYSHAEGALAQAIGDQSHAEGYNTKSIGLRSHAEGYQTVASGSHSHTEGQETQANGDGAHAEGEGTQAIGGFSHAEGKGTQAIGNYSHAEGASTKAIGNYSHTEGASTVASGSFQHVQGQYNISSSVQSAFILGNGIDDLNRSNLIFAAGNAVEITGSLNLTGSANFNSGSDTLVKVENGQMILLQVSASLDFANDAAAAAGGVPLGGLYRNGNTISIRIV